MTWLFSIGPRLKLYAVITLGVLVALGIAIAKIRASGAQKVRLEQLQDRMKQIQEDARIDANLSASTAAERRDRLRKRWSRR